MTFNQVVRGSSPRCFMLRRLPYSEGHGCDPEGMRLSLSYLDFMNLTGYTQKESDVSASLRSTPNERPPDVQRSSEPDLIQEEISGGHLHRRGL